MKERIFAAFSKVISTVKKLKVFKFGGASLKDAEAMKHVATILRGYTNDQLLIVGSATKGTTNDLGKVYNSTKVAKQNRLWRSCRTSENAIMISL